MAGAGDDVERGSSQVTEATAVHGRMSVLMMLVTKADQVIVRLLAGEGVFVAEMVQLDPPRGPARPTDPAPALVVPSFEQ